MDDAIASSMNVACHATFRNLTTLRAVGRLACLAPSNVAARRHTSHFPLPLRCMAYGSKKFTVRVRRRPGRQVARNLERVLGNRNCPSTGEARSPDQAALDTLGLYASDVLVMVYKAGPAKEASDQR
jgi:hypothetical protein